MTGRALRFLGRFGIWEITNGVLSLALASRFAIASKGAVDEPLYTGFANVVSNDAVWALFFSLFGVGIIALSRSRPEVRAGVRLLLVFWWFWLSFFIGAQNTDALSFRLMVGMAAVAVMEFAVFTATAMAPWRER